MILFLLPFLIAFVLSIGLTYGTRSLATRFGLLDTPDGDRRIHEVPVPRVGGIAVFLTMCVVLGGWILVYPTNFFEDERFRTLLTVLGGGTAMFALGLVDDLIHLRAREKLLVQVLIATSVFAAGVGIHQVTLPNGGEYVLPAILSATLTILWIVGITNAFNLIDGSDGVAGGAALFACGAMAVVFLLMDYYVGGATALILGGAVLGFLIFNFPPASIFLGDCGSLFVGFTLAALGLMTAETATTLLAVAIPVVSLGLPILDVLLAVMRRFLRGQPIFNPDRGHIHHRLKDLGHSPRRVALLLYAASAAFALLALLLVSPTGSITAPIFIVSGLILWIAVQRLDIPELLELRRIVHRGLQQRTVIANNVRLREAVERLQRSKSQEEIVECLEFALQAGEFVRAELWIDHSLGNALRRVEHADRNGHGVLWHWNAPSRAAGDVAWELRLPFYDPSGATVGRFSLWLSMQCDHVLTDMKLIAQQLHPELQEALVRVAGTIPLLPERVAQQTAAAGDRAAGSTEVRVPERAEIRTIKLEPRAIQ